MEMAKRKEKGMPLFSYENRDYGIQVSGLYAAKFEVNLCLIQWSFGQGVL